MIRELPAEQHNQPRALVRANSADRQATRWFSAVTLALVVALLTVIAAPSRGQTLPPNSFADLVDQVGDAVVNITTSSVVAGRAGGPQPQVPEGSPLEDFFNDFMDRQDPDRQARRSSALAPVS